MNPKVLGAIFAIVLIAVGVGLWRQQSVYERNQEIITRAFTASKAESVEQSVRLLLESYQHQLIEFATQKEAQKEVSLPTTFAAVLSAHRGGELRWQASASDFAPAPEWAEKVVSAAQLADLSPGQLRTTTWSAAPGSGAFVLVAIPALMKAQTVVEFFVLGLVPAAQFQAVTDIFKDFKGEVFVVDKSGNILAHTQDSQVGTVLAEEDPLREEWRQGRAKDEWQNATEGVAYRRIAGQDLYAVVRIRSGDMAGVGGVWSAWLLAFGLSVVGLSFLVLLSQRLHWGQQLISDETTDEVAPLASRQVEAKEPVVAPVPTAPAAPAPKSAETSLQEKMASYSQVASALAHELRIPLVAILGHAQLAKSKVSTDEAKNHFLAIETEARKGRELLERLMFFAGQKKVQYERLDLVAIVQEVLRRRRFDIEAKSIRVERLGASQAWVYGSAELLTIALDNLVQNCIEAMERQLIKNMVIEIQSTDSGSQLQLRDTGEGIGIDKIDKIFEPFFTTRTSDGHIGLGLSSALGILKEHQAELKVDSKEGQGTNLTLNFPKEVQQTVQAPELLEVKSNLPPAEKKAEEPRVEATETNLPKPPTRPPPPPAAAVTAAPKTPQPPPPPPPRDAKNNPVIGEKKIAAAAKKSADLARHKPIETPPEGLPQRHSLVEDVEVQIRRPGVRT